MDIRQLIFPFMMAVITNSIMIVIIYFLRKIPLFANLFSVSFMVILYLFCLLRIFVPIELPGVQIILKDDTVYAGLVESFFAYNDANHSGSHPKAALYIIIGIWIIGTLILAIRSFVVQNRFKKYLFANGDYATDKERKLFSVVAKEILKTDKNVALRKTDAINGALVIGLIHNTVLIPDESYSEEELRMMLLHECMHIRNKDLWVKLLVQIYCCIFWWNPFAYLLKKDLDLFLEMKCDLNTTKDFSDLEKLQYVETLKKRSVSAKSMREPFLVSAELVDGVKKDRLLERVKRLLASPPNKAKQITVNAVAAIVLLSVFISSYIFIWQPRFEISDIKEEYYELEGIGNIIDESNAYLVKGSDGNYLFYYSDYPPETVSKEEVEQGMYEGYPIYEN